ncbi:aspartate dehydrogenase [bacterium 0.1xD8-71]|nr:aspartate dehydrogenase [bacterium 0.1xD8-71]
MFFRKNQPIRGTYDRLTEKPILKCSICNGEQVAGFKNLQTGEFREIMLIKDAADLQHFKQLYDITDITKEY